MPITTPPMKTPGTMPAGKPMSGKSMNVWMIISAVLAVALIISIVTATQGRDSSLNKISGDQAGSTLISFVNEIYAGQIGQSTLKSVTPKSGLYEVVVTVDNAGQKVDQTVFVSQDGTLFFPQALNMEEVKTQYQAFQQSGQGAVTPPADTQLEGTPPAAPAEDLPAE